jgi:hypothetical protein
MTESSTITFIDHPDQQSRLLSYSLELVRRAATQ